MPPAATTLFPLDDRPVCYEVPQLLASMAGSPLALPPRALFGMLKQPADLAGLWAWFATLPPQETVLVAWPLLLFGGLIPARLQTEPLPVLQQRLMAALATLRQATPQLLGFNAIARIPAYNNAEEEPDYWATYGKRLHEASCQLHEQGHTAAKHLYEAMPDTFDGIPRAVWQDFWQRRQRLHALQFELLAALQAGQQEALVFCQDDTGAYGLNVQEAEALRAAATALSPEMQTRTWVQTGADEVAHTLLARSWARAAGRSPRVWVGYSHGDEGAAAMARFDGLPIEQVVAQRLAACGISTVSHLADADACLWLHTPRQQMGDHCSLKASDGVCAEAHNRVLAGMDAAAALGKPLWLADVAFANGSDASLLEAVLASTYFSSLAAYGGWNTPGNAIGSTVAMGLCRWLAVERGSVSEGQEKAFQTLLAQRLLEDGVYQALLRKHLRTLPLKSVPEQEGWLQAAFQPWFQRIEALLPQSACASWTPYLPCQRTFEVAFNQTRNE